MHQLSQARRRQLREAVGDKPSWPVSVRVFGAAFLNPMECFENFIKGADPSARDGQALWAASVASGRVFASHALDATISFCIRVFSCLFPGDPQQKGSEDMSRTASHRGGRVHEAFGPSRRRASGFRR